MSLLGFSCLCMFIVFAQLTESRVLILRGYDDEPLVLGHVDKSSAEEVEQKDQPFSSNYKPKRTHPKKTVLQYGRHIYHLNNFADSKDLRSASTQFEPDAISYQYVDIDDLFRVRDSAKNGVDDYLKDLLIFSDAPVQICRGNRCAGDLRKFSKHKKDDDTDWKHKKMRFGRMKRFQIVDNNRHKSKKYDETSESSEEHYQKKKESTQKKKKKYTSESTESKSKESDSAEKSSHKKTKKKYKPPKIEKKHSEESIEIKRKPKKKHSNGDSPNSVEERKYHNKYWKRDEYFHRKKKKKINYAASDETTRKTFAVEDDFFMQGNKIYHPNEQKGKKKHYDFDKRRRLEHFLPKRYHWDPSEIHDLGYYWFNGPKGEYPAPKVLYK